MEKYGRIFLFVNPSQDLKFLSVKVRCPLGQAVPPLMLDYSKNWNVKTESPHRKSAAIDQSLNPD
jgi:hypothetical protein